MPFQPSPQTVVREAQQEIENLAIKNVPRYSSNSEVKYQNADDLFHEPHTESIGHFEAVKRYLENVCDNISSLEKSATEEQSSNQQD